MVRSKRRRDTTIDNNDQINSAEIPIDKLPEKYINMKIKTGSKIRNVLEFAKQRFSEVDAILWSGAGQAVGKTISCSEIFRGQYNNLHRITKLRYIKSEKKEGSHSLRQQVPEIHIFLVKNTGTQESQGIDNNESIEDKKFRPNKVVAKKCKLTEI